MHEVLESERERNKQLMEMHERMLAEFQNSQQKFLEYTQNKPEKPIYKPEVACKKGCKTFSFFF
jgi:hypothetical protein